MSEWKLIGGGIIGGEEVIIYYNNVTHEISEVPIGTPFNLTKAL